MILIRDRSPEAADRAAPGHWEGDLLIGKGARSAIGTLVERSSRCVILLHLPHGRTAEDVCAPAHAPDRTTSVSATDTHMQV
jgi:IS30 family transposase